MRGPGAGHGYYKELKVRGQRKVGREHFLPEDLNSILPCDLCFLLPFVYQELILGSRKLCKLLCFGGILSVRILMSQRIKDCCLCNLSGSGS